MNPSIASAASALRQRTHRVDHVGDRLVLGDGAWPQRGGGESPLASWAASSFEDASSRATSDTDITVAKMLRWRRSSDRDAPADNGDVEAPRPHRVGEG